MAWTLHTAAKCNSCGTFPEDWLDDEGKYKDPPPFEVTTRRCVGCQVLQDKRKEIPSEDSMSIHLFFKKFVRERVSKWPMRQSK